MNGEQAAISENAEIALVADELARAVELTHNAAAAHEARLQAYNAYESFKENSPWCAQAGLILASSPQYSAIVKHFGLQLMEQTVKYRWTHIHQAEKIFIKENSMKLLSCGGWDICHLNDALARVVVEMVKREWPQHWPTLLAELSAACSNGNRQTEIVLHVLLRLVEDVATLQTLEQNQRRKDIYQALTSNMAEIFAFFLRLIELHVQKFRDKTANGEFEVAASHGRVVQVVLITLAGFVEWVSLNHVVTQDGRLLQILCVLLEDQAFQLQAADCLLQIVNRKGSVKERKPLIILFNEEAVSCLHRAAVASSQVMDEKNYTFLKKLVQVLVGLTQQLCALWPGATPATVPQNPSPCPCAAALTAALTSLLAHPALVVAATATQAWLALTKHHTLARHPSLLSATPALLHHATRNIIKVPYPTSRPTTLTADASAFISIDFDSENEYNAFFLKSRNDFIECFRQVTNVAPLATWSFVEQWARVALEKGVSIPNEPPVLQTHPLVAEWEALSMALESVISKLLNADARPNAVAGLSLLELCLSHPTQHSALLSYLLSFISALFVFLSMASCQLQQGTGAGAIGAELLPRVLEKILSSLLHENPGAADAALAVRRHAAALLVKLAKQYPLLLLAVFPRLHQAAKTFKEKLAGIDNVTVQEAVILVSNHFCDYNRQTALIGDILGTVPAQLTSISPHLEDGASLIRYLGFHDDPSRQSMYINARRQLINSLMLLQGVVRRAAVPDDPDKAMRGGFSGGVTTSGNPIWRNPCASHVLPLLPHVLRAARAAAHAHSQPLHHGWRPPINVSRAERAALLGARNEQVNRGESSVNSRRGEAAGAGDEAAIRLLANTTEAAWTCVGTGASSLGRALYSMPGAGPALAIAATEAAAALPPARLRTWLRVFLKPLLYHCPPAHYTDVAVPVLAAVAPIMLDQLSRRWEYIASLYESGRLNDESNDDTEEVLEDVLNRQLTREYLDVLKVALVGGALSESDGVAMEEETPTRAPEQVSELGDLMLACNEGSSVLGAALSALGWPDSTGSLRAAALVAPCIRSAGPQLGSAPAARVLVAILDALRVHGEHDANQTQLLALAVTSYEALAPRHTAALQSVLAQVPGADPADLRRLHERVLASSGKPSKVDKPKRDLFRKIVSGLIGRNVGQLFKKEVFIMDLPTMAAQPKDKPISVMDSKENSGLTGLFAQNAPT